MNKMVTIPREEYDRLREAAEDLADLRAYDGTKAALAAGEEELVPAEYAKRLIAGESPLRVWRELRGLSQVKLGAVSEVTGCRSPISRPGAARGRWRRCGSWPMRWGFGWMIWFEGRR